MPYKDPERQAQYQREYVARRRREWIDEHGPCARCGAWENLDVDHTDAATKVIPVSHVWNMSPTNPRRLAELAKCQVLCEPCHSDKTTESGEHAKGEAHGGSILSESEVIEMRRLYAAGGVTYEELAHRFGLGGKSAARQVVLGIHWSHIPGALSESRTRTTLRPQAPQACVSSIPP